LGWSKTVKEAVRIVHEAIDAGREQHGFPPQDEVAQ
jgi:hypothetical protein